MLREPNPTKAAIDKIYPVFPHETPIDEMWWAVTEGAIRDLTRPYPLLKQKSHFWLECEPRFALNNPKNPSIVADVRHPFEMYGIDRKWLVDVLKKIGIWDESAAKNARERYKKHTRSHRIRVVRDK